MKKTLSILIIIFAILSFAACSSFEITSNGSASPSVPASEATTNVALSKQSTIETAESIEPGTAEQPANGAEQSVSNPDDTKMLVIYYSLTGTTKAAAVIVQESVGGDFFEITTVDEYAMAHDDTLAQVDKYRSENYLPQLSSKLENLDDYDSIFLGYPIWRGTFADPMAAFLRDYDLSGKTVNPFSTSGSGTLGTSVEDLKALEPNAIVLDGLAVRGNAQSSITEWLNKLGITK